MPDRQTVARDRHRHRYKSGYRHKIDRTYQYQISDIMSVVRCRVLELWRTRGSWSESESASTSSQCAGIAGAVPRPLWQKIRVTKAGPPQRRFHTTLLLCSNENGGTEEQEQQLRITQRLWCLQSPILLNLIAGLKRGLGCEGEGSVHAPPASRCR